MNCGDASRSFFPAASEEQRFKLYRASVLESDAVLLFTVTEGCR